MTWCSFTTEPIGEMLIDESDVEVVYYLNWLTLTNER
jgi:hypothetical protein